MRRIFSLLFVLLGFLSLAISGCERCEEEEVASLLFPPLPEDALGVSAVSFRELDAGISCLDSRFFEIADSWPSNQVLSDFYSASGNANHGSWMAAGLIIRSDAGVSGLQDMGCLDELPANELAIDWSTQAVVVVHVQSDEGCLSSSGIALGTAPDGAPYLNVQVKYQPNDNCEFDFYRTVIVDRKGVKAHLSVVSECAESNEEPDV